MSPLSPSPLDAPNITYLWTQLLVEELVRCGVKTFFVAPGSRSTPLTAAAARHPDTEVVLHVDERGTAFAALGVGRTTQRPAAWITTSGTAVANGFPAVVEAAMDGVPMVLLTADRPPELRDTGANQTIDQVKIFGDYVCWQAEVPPPTNEIDPSYVLTTVDQAVHQSLRKPAGPVHLNCAFRKPLEPVETEAAVDVSSSVRTWAEEESPFTQYPSPKGRPSDGELDGLAEALQGLEKGLVVAGRLDSSEEAEAVLRLARGLDWPLFPDLTSRLRLGSLKDITHVPYGDLVLTSEAFQEVHAPQAVLQVGGRFTSKRLRQFLKSSSPEVRAVVRPSPARVDPDHRATHHVEADISAFAEGLCSRLDSHDVASGWAEEWRTANESALRVIERHVEDARQITEPLVASLVSRNVPSDHALVAASSMPVRDLNRHAVTTGPAVPVYANRGASGIDGTVSTAAGIAQGRGGPVTLLIGDLALWHDLNGLAFLRERPVVVVVVNNDGGGIFHFLPIRDHEQVFDPYFTTPHGRSFEDAASTFDLAYSQPETPSAFVEAYSQACERSGASLIEVQTDREVNLHVHETVESDVAEAIEKDTP